MAEKQTSKDRMREIVDSIENGIKELFESDKYQQYLSTMSRFHRYSVNNTMLIYMQRPDATHVAGFNKWRDQFGRNVLKGEKGIRIIAPTPYKKKVEEIKTDPETNAPLLDADGKAIIEEKEIRIPMFKVVSVFDVSQTTGKPLPQLAADLSGNVQQYEVFMEALRRASPVPMEIKPVARDTDGFFSIKAQSITIRAGMSEVQTVCAAVHEIAHAKLHDYEHMTELADDGETILVPGEKSRNTEEVEAESISYAVCQYYGIETGENSFGYIATWSKGKELKELRASLETINKTASELITDIDRHFAEICKERGINREEVSATQTDEALYLVDGSVYLHVQHTDGGWDYSLYDKESKKLLDGGVIDSSAIEDSPVASVAGAVRTEVFAIQGMTPTKVTFADMKILEDLQEAQITPPLDSEQITGAVAVPTDAADNMLPELEQAVPMPDPTLTVDDMRSYGYLDSDMLPLSKDRALELLEHDITVYMLHPGNAEEMVFEAEDIIKQLDDGADFAELAKEYSTDTATAQQGGELGYFTADQMITEFSDAAFALEPGEYTKEPVETSYGYHVILCEDKKAAHHQSFDEVKDELTEQLTDQEVQTKYYDAMSALQEDATIEYLSDDYNPDKLIEEAQKAMEAEQSTDSSAAESGSASTEAAADETTEDAAAASESTDAAADSSATAESGDSLVDSAE